MALTEADDYRLRDQHSTMSRKQESPETAALRRKGVDKLQRIYNHHVKQDPEKKLHNKQISMELMDKFTNHCTKQHFLTDRTITITPHGSAFENLQVGEPDEFDFMVILDYNDKPIEPILSSDLGNKAPVRESAGYFALRLHPDVPDAVWVRTYSTKGSMTGHTYLSAQMYEKELRNAVADFVKKNQHYKSKHAKKIELKDTSKDMCVMMTLTVGREIIKIYLSAGLEIAFTDSDSDKDSHYFFAKRDRGEINTHLWILSTIEEESSLINLMSWNHVACHAVCRYLFETFIPKQVLRTSLLNLYRFGAYGYKLSHKDEEDYGDMVHNHVAFLLALIGFLNAALTQDDLKVYGSSYEDVLERLDDETLNHARKMLDKLHRMIASGMLLDVIDYLDRLAAKSCTSKLSQS